MKPARRVPRHAGAAALALVIAACGGSASDSPDGKLAIVATTTVLGDLARSVAGDDATVEVILPVGADPHDYQASARQAAALVEADLVIVNGLGLEEGLADVLDNAAADGANILELAERVDPIPFGSGDEADPHIWLDPVRMAKAARLVAAELARLDPGVDWAARADSYADQLEDVDAQVKAILAAVPAGNRKLVTNHDALGYFAARYDFQVVDVVIPGGSTLAEPSSAGLADLVARIEEEGVTAIFAETTEPAVLAEAVAAEAGGDVAVIELYTGSLGEPGSGAETLAGMLLVNAKRIAAALS